MLSLSKNQSCKIPDGINDEVDESENRSNGNVFLSKKSKNANSKNLTYKWNLVAMRKIIFLIPGVKKTFNQLRLSFTKALIL